jgi:predicted transcriptional regulator
MFTGKNNYSESDDVIIDKVITQVETDKNIITENTIDQECSFSHTTDHLVFTPTYNQSQKPIGTRNTAQYDYDLRIKTLNITYSGLTPWIVTISNKNYYYFIAGGIDEQTFFRITLENHGNQEISSSENVLLKMNLTDNYGHTSWEQQEYLGHFPAKKRLILDYTWEPTYSNYFILTCNLSFQNDQNQTNNFIKIFNLYTKKWGDNLEDGNISDWSGHLAADKWHLTESVEEDPNPNAHTSNYAFYHGLEKPSEKDDYGEDNDFELITPEIDLRRFDVEKDTYLYFKYYGKSSISDDLTIEGYKSSEQKWNQIAVEFKDITLNKSDSPTWMAMNSSSKDFIPHIGIDIDTYAGHLAKFKFHWQSDQSPENNIGFYLDDFFIYGFETPLPKYEIGIESVEILVDNNPIIVGQKFQVKAKITNYGDKNVFGLEVNASVKDFSDRLETVKSIGSNKIKSLETDESKTILWEVIPTVAGIYYASVSVDFTLDEKIENNDKQSEAVKVHKYYSSFESDDPNWLSEPGWTRVQIGNEDPAPSEHSWSDAWYVGNISSKLYDKNLSTGLYSPIIDLDGAQTNDLYKNNQIEIGFKWFGETSNDDILYFEYALDHTDNWLEFNVTSETQSKINGDKSDRWYSWDSLGFPELFGHHVQFRWRFESDLISSDNEMGFYIDDFFIWIVQEQYGRPIITGCQIYPNSVINDSHDSVHLTCQVTNSSTLGDVFVDLTPINGPSDQVLFNDGTHGDQKNGDNEFTIEFTVSPDVPSGEYIFKLTALDELNRFDNNYVIITVKENLAPVIIEYSPNNLSLNIDEDEKILFQIAAMDPEGGDLKYSWYLNSILIKDWTKDFYQFDSQFHGQYSAGNYQLKVVVADNGYPNKLAFLDWNIWVIDVLPDFQVEDKDIKISDDGVSGNNVTENSLVSIRVWIHNLRPPTENNVSIIFIQQSTNASIEDHIFNVYNISKFPGNESTLITILWQANISTKYIKVWVDPTDNIFELDEDNNEASIQVNVSKPPLIETPDNKIINETARVPYLLYLIVTGIITSVIALSFAIGTEFGRYKLFSMLAPLYYRVTGDKVLEHKLRSKIYMHIRANPGDHYRSIMTKLKIKNGTLVHHLSRLEQEELIRSERDGYFKRFYPVSMRIPKSEVGMYYPEGIPTYNIGEHQVSEIQLKIIETMRKYPGLTQKDIANKVNESRRVVNYHIKLLGQHDLIRVVKSGRTTQCYAVEKRTSS